MGWAALGRAAAPLVALAMVLWQIWRRARVQSSPCRSLVEEHQCSRAASTFLRVRDFWLYIPPPIRSRRGLKRPSMASQSRLWMGQFSHKGMVELLYPEGFSTVPLVVAEAAVRQVWQPALGFEETLVVVENAVQNPLAVGREVVDFPLQERHEVDSHPYWQMVLEVVLRRRFFQPLLERAVTGQFIDGKLEVVVGGGWLPLAILGVCD